MTAVRVFEAGGLVLATALGVGMVALLLRAVVEYLFGVKETEFLAGLDWLGRKEKR